MNGLLRANHAAGKLDRAIGDYLVGIHIGLRARTRLEHDQRKLTVPTAVDHFLRGTYDQVDFFLRKLAQLPVGEGSAFFQDAERSDHGAAPAKTLNSDREIHVGALGLCAPQLIGWNLYIP